MLDRLKNRYFQFNKRHSVIFTWLISYVLILLIPVVISTIIYVRAASIVETEINRANESILMQIQQEVDSKLRDIRKICMELGMDKKVIEVANMNEPVNDQEYYKIIDFARDLKIFKAGNEFLDGLYIYFRKNDVILSSNARIEMKEKNNSVQEHLGMSYEEAKAFLQKVTAISIQTTSKKNEQNESNRSIVYANPISDNTMDMPNIVVLLVLEESKLLNNINKIPSVPNGKVMILNSKGTVMASSNRGLPTPDIQYEELVDAKGLLHHRDQGETSVVSYISSREADWKYIMVTPAQIFWQKARQIRNLTYISFALCMLLGGIAAYFLLKNNYSSVSLMLKFIAERMGTTVDKKYNEYAFIQDVLNNTFDENMKIATKLKQQNPVIRDNFITKLLKGKIQETDAVFESLSAMDLHFPTERFAVMLISVDNFSGFSGAGEKRGEDAAGLVEFVIRNVVEELMAETHQCYIVDVDNVLACLVNFGPNGEADAVEELMRVADEARRFIGDKFHIFFTVSISQEHSSVYKIPQAYAECLEAMEYKMVMGSGKIIGYRDIAGRDAISSGYTYYYPLLIEQQLINYIKVGDYKGAFGIIEEVFEKNLLEGAGAVQMAQCLMFNLVGTVLKTMNELSALHKSDFLKELNPTERLLGCDTVEEIKIELSSILKNVCDYVQEARRNENTSFYEKVKEFIVKNYKNSGLSVNAIGEYFDMAPSYVSKLFKEQTGESLLDFMNGVRISKAKEYLMHHPYTVQEVSDMVGYNDLKTFTRYFKKYEGITPGKFKETF